MPPVIPLELLKVIATHVKVLDDLDAYPASSPHTTVLERLERIVRSTRPPRKANATLNALALTSKAWYKAVTPLKWQTINLATCSDAAFTRFEADIAPKYAAYITSMHVRQSRPIMDETEFAPKDADAWDEKLRAKLAVCIVNATTNLTCLVTDILMYSGDDAEKRRYRGAYAKIDWRKIEQLEMLSLSRASGAMLSPECVITAVKKAPNLTTLSLEGIDGGKSEVDLRLPQVVGALPRLLRLSLINCAIARRQWASTLFTNALSQLKIVGCTETLANAKVDLPETIPPSPSAALLPDHVIGLHMDTFTVMSDQPREVRHTFPLLRNLRLEGFITPAILDRFKCCPVTLLILDSDDDAVEPIVLACFEEGFFPRLRELRVTTSGPPKPVQDSLRQRCAERGVELSLCEREVV